MNTVRCFEYNSIDPLIKPRVEDALHEGSARRPVNGPLFSMQALCWAFFVTMRDKEVLHEDCSFAKSRCGKPELCH